MGSLWSNLRSTKQLKIVKYSAIWLLVVPLCVKLFEEADSIVDLKLFAQGLKLNLELPFSWQLFYLAALLFTIAGLIYRFRCPQLIVENTDFVNYVEVGGSQQKLERYITENALKDFEKDILTKLKSAEFSEVEFRTQFEKCWEAENTSSLVMRWIIYITYLLGFGLIGAIMWQNFLYVLPQITFLPRF